MFGIDCRDYFAGAREAYKSLACPKFMYNYVVIVVSGYWASCPDTGQQELCKNINFAMEIKAKKLNCLSSYEGLNRFSLRQTSELLRLTKESYCNLKLKCPDTGKHTVMCHEIPRLPNQSDWLS